MESITRYVEQRLKLRVNRQKSAVALAVERPLLGFSFFRDKTGRVRITVAPKAVKRAEERIRRLTKRSWGVSMKRRIEEGNRFTGGWTGYFASADTSQAFDQLDRLAAPPATTGPVERSGSAFERATGTYARSVSPTERPAHRRPRSEATGASRDPGHSNAPCQTPTGMRPTASKDSTTHTVVFGMPSDPPAADPHVRWCGGAPG
jgi:group II intron maturase